MVASELSSGRRVRRWRSVSEKRQIVQLTLEPGASVAEVARAHGVNANQVFKWRREFERGELADTFAEPIPVTVTGSSRSTSDAEQARPGACRGAIHIELQGRAVISVESGADPSLVRLILESLRTYRASSRTKIWIAAGVTYLRRGFDGLSAQVQNTLHLR